LTLVAELSTIYPKLLGRSAGGGCAKIKWILVSRSPQHVGYIVYRYWARDWRCLQKYIQRSSRARKRLLLPQSQGSHVSGKPSALTLDGPQVRSTDMHSHRPPWHPSLRGSTPPTSGGRGGDSPPRVRESTSHKIPKAAASSPHRVIRPDDLRCWLAHTVSPHGQWPVVSHGRSTECEAEREVKFTLEQVKSKQKQAKVSKISPQPRSMSLTRGWQGRQGRQGCCKHPPFDHCRAQRNGGAFGP
jgi:hypothetical protein